MDEGLLAVLVTVASEDWQDARIMLDTLNLTDAGEPRSLPGSRQQRVDTILDIFDIRTGLLLARTRIPSTATFSKNGLIYQIRVSELGVFGVEAFEIEFERPPESRLDPGPVN